MKQTAVEWLIDKLSNIKAEDFNSTLEVRLIIQQAKEMEKEQIVDAFGVGCQVESTRLIGYQDIADDYFNETYGKADNS